jgi:hypothetical protein
MLPTELTLVLYVEGRPKVMLSPLYVYHDTVDYIQRSPVLLGLGAVS